MGKIAFVFSGQGAQHPGMAKDFYDTNERVKSLFDEADAVRPGTLSQLFDSEAEVLKQTENTQPCLYLADLAAAIALEDAGIKAEAVAGFSLGEIPALSFAGAVSYLDGFRIACQRGKAMAEASKSVDASMLAVLKMENEEIETLCQNYERVYPVNYNCHGQLVVSGLKEELAKFKEDIKNAGGRAVELNVSGGFHSPFMDPAAKEFSRVLDDFEIGETKIPVYSNYTGNIYEGNAKALMLNQINHPVKWEQIIKSMIASGFDTFIEAGVGNVLQKLITKISREVKSFQCETPADIEAIVKEL